MDVHGASEYFAQASQALEPEVLKDPAVQPKHFDIESAPRIAENVPAGHLGCHEFSGVMMWIPGQCIFVGGIVGLEFIQAALGKRLVNQPLRQWKSFQWDRPCKRYHSQRRCQRCSWCLLLFQRSILQLWLVLISDIKSSPRFCHSQNPSTTKELSRIHDKVFHKFWSKKDLGEMDIFSQLKCKTLPSTLIQSFNAYRQKKMHIDTWICTGILGLVTLHPIPCQPRRGTTARALGCSNFPGRARHASSITNACEASCVGFAQLFGIPLRCLCGQNSPHGQGNWNGEETCWQVPAVQHHNQYKSLNQAHCRCPAGIGNTYHLPASSIAFSMLFHVDFQYWTCSDIQALRLALLLTPDWFEKVPAAQGSHSLRPLMFEKNPSGQSWQTSKSVAPDLAPNSMAAWGQCTHSVRSTTCSMDLHFMEKAVHAVRLPVSEGSWLACLAHRTPRIAAVSASLALPAPG